MRLYAIDVSGTGNSAPRWRLFPEPLKACTLIPGPPSHEDPMHVILIANIEIYIAFPVFHLIRNSNLLIIA